jgi:hypothetical protein
VSARRWTPTWIDEDIRAQVAVADRRSEHQLAEAALHGEERRYATLRATLRATEVAEQIANAAGDEERVIAAYRRCTRRLTELA